MNSKEETEKRRSSEWICDFIKFGFTTKKCKNCNWSAYEKGDIIIACGHHIANFTTDSSCGSWTSPTDKDLLEAKAKRLKAFKKKYNKS